jgi:alpha-tubulin suppressor-like RCC1 family protein
VKVILLPSQIKGRYSHGTCCHHERTDSSFFDFNKFLNILKIINRGSNYCGQLGHGRNNGESYFYPKKVEALADEVIVQVACGLWHTCAVTSTGSIFTWGEDSATGHGTEGSIFQPRLLQDLSSKGVISVSASFFTACVTKAGELFIWGCRYEDIRDRRLENGNDYHQQEAPKRVEALVGEKVQMVACGEHHTAICTEDGHVYTFGKGEYGQLGHGDEENKTSPTLVQALEGKHITQVQCGRYHTMALTSSGYVFTWGDAYYGVLGHDGSDLKFGEYCSIPCLVEGLDEHNVVQIASVYEHCAALVDPTSPPSSIRQSQENTFNNQEHSDVVFMVEDEPLYANVDILSQKSDYFAAMFRRVVNVPHYSKAAFLCVLEYLCLDDFTISSIDEDDLVEVWALADMYQLEGLKYSCMGALERGLCEKNVYEILQEAENLVCPCDGLKRMCNEFLERKKVTGDE